ncbi:D-alanyl-D-alanine carboxypeptidase [Streptomyces macrosporus]|uniref:D-alanyl-D-alanine carboxypeptidase n=1 Tax=Streptomyces macrosporus TaxID=44032 RepID=A0ABN3KI25_9ACTN
MVGKSPDRSEQQMSSGETTGKVETVPERARDPRVALQEPPRNEAESDEDGKPSLDGDAPGKTAAEVEKILGTSEKTRKTEETAAGADAEDDAEDEDRDRAEGTSEEDDAEAADGAESTSEGADEAEKTEAEDDEEEPASEPERPVDRTTTVFRVPEAEDAEAASEEDGKPESESKAASEPERPVDRTTTIFRVPKDKTEAKTEDTAEDTEDTAEKTGKAEKAGTTEDVDPVDQPTAMFRAVRPAAAPEPSGRTGTAGSGDKAKGEEKAEADNKAGTGQPEETDAERTSRFVPLRSPDAPAGASEARPLPELPESERTKQQPLPPHKPLELLAELTNKPAPPPTPLRTALRRIKIWSPLVVLLAIILSIVQLLRPLPEPELVLTVSATHSFDGGKPSLAWPEEGQAAVEVEGLGSLGSYGEQKPVPIASVAKTMTAYVILREHPLKKGEEGPRIPVDRRAEEEASLPGESTVKVKAGKEITLYEALNAVMIASANNVARLLARWDAGSEEAFVKKMNATAKELGMNDTTYTDPSGLRKETVSTAADQVKLGKKVMDYEVFREIVKLPYYIDGNGDRQNNWNGLVPFNGAVGIKPGTSTAAGGNMLFAAEKQIGGTTQLIIGAVLGQHKPSIIDTVVAESRELMISAQEVLESEKVIEKGDVVGYVDDGLGGRTPLVATEDVTAIGWPGMETELALTDGGKGVPHEAPAGETVGTLTVGSGPGQVKVPVAVQSELVEPGVGAKLTRVL